LVKSGIEFPINPFPDVEPKDFNKLNKKRVTEDFVSENFEMMGWKVFEPFTDTGIDRILSKKVCPSGHTGIKVSEDICTQCGKQTIDILRFLQIKTRALKNGIFGFTLKSKDIRIDPRHVYVLYCDTTQDFFIIPVFEYLKFFDEINSNPFASTAFRKGNQKLNSLRYDQSTDSWSWGRHSWERFRNTEGLKKMQDPNIDLNLIDWVKKTRELSNKLLITFSSGGTYPSNLEETVNKALASRMQIFENKQQAAKAKQDILDYLKNTIKDGALFQSIMKYWETVKNLEIAGGEEMEEE